MTRRISPSNPIRLVTSAGTAFAPIPESTLPIRKLIRLLLEGERGFGIFHVSFLASIGAIKNPPHLSLACARGLAGMLKIRKPIPLGLSTLGRGAGRAELAKFDRSFWLTASRSPSPRPSPAGRGNTASRAATSRGALDWRKRGERFSLSRRERAGVRGNSWTRRVIVEP